jgi:antibiotic biosynthesis monooxygenase (ABM) superfamily enzyme
MMTKKATKKAAKGFIQIETVMPKAVQKKTGVDQLKAPQLANLNAWLNLPKTKALLGPVGGGKGGNLPPP